MSHDIKILVSGAAGTGKSAIIQLISNALSDAGLSVSIESRTTVREPKALLTTVNAIRDAGLKVRIMESHPLAQAVMPRTGIEGIDE